MIRSFSHAAKTTLAPHARVMSVMTTRAFHRNAFCSRGFNDFFFPLHTQPSMKLLESHMNRPLLLDKLGLSDMHVPGSIFGRSLPFYEISEDDKQFQLAVDVPGVKTSDMKLRLADGGRVLKLSGERKTFGGDNNNGSDGTRSQMTFERRFLIDQSIDATKIAARLSDGVLFITAPKKSDAMPEQEIVIQQEEVDDHSQDVKVNLAGADLGTKKAKM